MATSSHIPAGITLRNGISIRRSSRSNGARYSLGIPVLEEFFSHFERTIPTWCYLLRLLKGTFGPRPSEAERRLIQPLGAWTPYFGAATPTTTPSRYRGEPQ